MGKIKMEIAKDRCLNDLKQCADGRGGLLSRARHESSRNRQCTGSLVLYGGRRHGGTSGARARDQGRRQMRSSMSLLLACLGQFQIASCGWETGSSRTLDGKYWGAQEWIHGWGRPGEPMKFCPVQCTINSDTWTHEGPDKGYEKHWDREGWKQPQYSSNTAEEYKAGLEPPKPGFVQAGAATLCKKPYPVCDYPNGDVFEIQIKTTDPQCMSSMKHFLCTLYRRRCMNLIDQDPKSTTKGNQAIRPVCFDQCMNAYKDCKFDIRHSALMCVCKEWERTHQVRGCNTTGEYIKAGWVDYTKVEMEADQCDAPAATVRPYMWITWTSAVVLCIINFFSR